MKKVTAFFGLSLMLVMIVSFCTIGKEKIEWLSFARMQEAYAKNPKPIIVDVYTGWCGWCKVMDKETYGNEKVAAYINEKYYAVKFDAETQEGIEWRGKKYGYNAQYKINELALYLLNGQLSYPTTVFLVTPDAKPAPLAGYLKPKEIESPLRFFGDGFYKTKNFPEYLKGFSASW
ncbi:MAG: hypothetical protein JWP81_4792 [Ferruginibacter sp.]|nr:hypothetical protein [Ferruginibacter sp.]